VEGVRNNVYCISFHSFKFFIITKESAASGRAVMYICISCEGDSGAATIIFDPHGGEKEYTFVNVIIVIPFIPLLFL